MGGLQRSLACVNLYAASAFFVKLSLFLLYLQLFKPHKVTRWLVYGGISICGLFYSVSIIINCVIIMPTRDQPDTTTGWRTRMTETYDFNKKTLIAQATFGTLSDIYLLMIPLRSIFQLQLPMNRKFGVSAVFLIGVMSVIV